MLRARLSPPRLITLNQCAFIAIRAGRLAARRSPAHRTLLTQAATSSPSISSPPCSSRAAPLPKSEGTISSVFASLSGGSLSDPLAPRFQQLKQSIVRSPSHKRALQTAWREVLASLQSETEEVIERGASLVPQIIYPGDDVVDKQGLREWAGEAVIKSVKERGTVVVKGVVPCDRVLRWKQSIRDYAKANPQTKDFPQHDPQVFELYWCKAQLEARGHPSLLRISRALLSLFHAPVNAEGAADVPSASLSNVLSYCDRLRIRLPGDATFALGPHIDGGGVERWEDPTLRDVWGAILQPDSTSPNGIRTAWQNHDSWSLGPRGERLTAKTDLYNGPGACSVFRPLQGWTSMSSTGADEGTLRVLPILRSATAYIILKPFFRPEQSLEQCFGDQARFLHPDNWRFDVSDSRFDGCSLGRNIELNDETHPHLRLSHTMTSVPRVEPGDCVFWHCDVVHAVEAKHAGMPGQDSSVLYIPAIPLTAVNYNYVQHQRRAFENGTPPPDFPGGIGESTHVGRGTPSDIIGNKARRAMGLEAFAIDENAPAAEQRLLHDCNAQLSE